MIQKNSSLKQDQESSERYKGIRECEKSRFDVLACSRQQRSTETWAIVLNLAKFILDVFRSLSKTIQYYFFEKETEWMIQNLRCNFNAAFWNNQGVKIV